MEKITNKKAAQAAFEAEYSTLASALNPCSQFYSGFQFVRQTIQVRSGEPFKAYIAHDDNMENTMIVPCDPNENGAPDIVDFKDVHVVKEILTEVEAKESFIAEFGSLARALNPASQAYMGFKFKQETIAYQGHEFKAFIASDTAKVHVFVVPVDGEIPFTADYGEVTIVKRKKR